MARKATISPPIPIRPAESISQELAEDPGGISVPTARSPVAEESHEEEFLNLKKGEGLRKLKIEVDLLQAQVDKITGENLLRKLLSTLIFLTVFGWLMSVIYILCKVGSGMMFLSDKVLITLLTTTSINVIGLLVIVANYLFNKSKST